MFENNLNYKCQQKTQDLMAKKNALQIQMNEMIQK